MGIMRETGLANVISDFFVNTSTPTTFPLFTFWGAGILNFFIPSGGGQWAIQAPVVIPAAESLGVSVPLSTMAVAWGDAWTNLAQPFWALPVLAIAGLSAKDILGFTLTILVVSGLYLSALFFIFS
ncbi:MAG: TIGR00366 family protein, partial [Bdellovibrionales bacterium]|nr:TIGR00366 family protein [Bdellovibrionales bacterium]